MLLSPAGGYEGQMPGYCENVGELVGVPWLRVVSPSSDKFATLLPHAGGTSQARDGAPL
jgi:hypothetical protein